MTTKRTRQVAKKGTASKKKEATKNTAQAKKEKSSTASAPAKKSSAKVRVVQKKTPARKHCPAPTRKRTRHDEGGDSPDKEGSNAGKGHHHHSAPAAAVPCARRQDHLDDLKAKTNIPSNGYQYEDYFFNVGEKKGRWEKWKDAFPSDDNDRCKKCRCKISEHAASPAVPHTLAQQLVAKLNNGEHGAEVQQLFYNVAQEYKKGDGNSYCAQEYKEGDGNSYCAPRQLAETVGEKEWRKALTDARGTLKGLASNCQDSRGPRVLRLVAGTGCGKTHALFAMKKALQASHFVYIAYNLDQDLTSDRQSPRCAALLRLILRFLGASNLGCSYFFAKHRDVLTTLDLGKVKQCAVYLLQKTKPAIKHLAIGVDELRLLDKEHVRQIASVLGEVAYELQNPNSGGGVKKCTVLATSLAGDSFQTTSGRHILPVAWPPPKENDIQFLMKNLLGGVSEIDRALVAAAAGAHFRSIVVTCDRISEVKVKAGDPASKSVSALTAPEAIFEQLGMRPLDLAKAAKPAIKSYVIGKLSNPTEEPETVAEPYCDQQGAVFPAIIFQLFGRDSAATQVFRLCLGEKEKLLENAAVAFDKFRAVNGVPFFASMTVHRPDKGDYAFAFDPSTLCFPYGSGFSLSEESLFEVRGKKVVRTTVVPQRGNYYHPEARNHPWIDRACILVDSKGTECLVVYQDKINANLADAVKDLNKAAEMLKKEFPSVLCVAHVAGLPNKSKRSAFEHPYLVISSEKDIETFYSPSFAPAIRFLKGVHKGS